MNNIYTKALHLDCVGSSTDWDMLNFAKERLYDELEKQAPRTDDIYILPIPKIREVMENSCIGSFDPEDEEDEEQTKELHKAFEYIIEDMNDEGAEFLIIN